MKWLCPVAPSIYLERARRSTSVFTALLLLCSIACSDAKAGIFQFDLGGGVNHASSGAITSSGLLSGLGGSANWGFLVTFSDGSQPYQLQFGLHQRISTNSDNGSSYLTAPLYPTLRLQVTRLFVSVGATKFAWLQTPDHPSLSLAPSVIQYAVFTELGVLWPIVPIFSLGASVGGSMIKGPTVPTTTVDAQVFMRFYFWPFKVGEGGSKFKSMEFEGWRYPLGMIR